MAGIGADDVSMFDLYSCFPSAVQMGLDALGVKADDPRPLTVTGGLPYAGGPGNNYVMHSVATMVQRLRESPGEYGLLTGLGWFSTKHSAGVYSTRPPQGDWRRADPAVDQREVDAMDSPPFVEQAEGDAIVETYTVIFNREAEPEQGIVIGRLNNGDPALASSRTRRGPRADARDDARGVRGHPRASETGGRAERIRRELARYDDGERLKSSISNQIPTGHLRLVMP